MNENENTNETGAKIRAEYVAIKGDRNNAGTQFFFALRFNGKRYTAFELLCGGIVGMSAEHFGEINRDFCGRFSKVKAAAALPDFMAAHGLEIPEAIEIVAADAALSIAADAAKRVKNEKAFIAAGAAKARARGSQSSQNRWIRLAEKYAASDTRIAGVLTAQKEADKVLANAIKRRDAALAEAEEKARKAEERKAAKAEKHMNGCEVRIIKHETAA